MNLPKARKNTFMSNITELSPNFTGSKSTTHKKQSQIHHNNNKEASKSSYITTIQRKDSISNASRHNFGKYDTAIAATEKKQMACTKKIKLVLTTNQVKQSDANHYAASVGIPVRSFLTNSSNKISNNLRNAQNNYNVKGPVTDSKGDYMAEMQRLQSAKSAKASVSSTYLKKFKSHNA